MTLPGAIFLKLIAKSGWDVRFVWSEEQPIYEARKGSVVVFGTTPENLFDAWTNQPEVIQEVLGINVINFEFETPVEVKHEVVEDQG